MNFLCFADDLMCLTKSTLVLKHISHSSQRWGKLLLYEQQAFVVVTEMKVQSCCIFKLHIAWVALEVIHLPYNIRIMSVDMLP